MIEPFVHFIRLHNISPETILDIGSRDLMQSVEFRRFFPYSRIIAFEPNPDQFDICNSISQFAGIEFYPIAISKLDCEVDFYAVDKNCKDPNVGASSLLSFSEDLHKQCIERHGEMRVWANKIKVKSRNLDNILKEISASEAEVIWMDTQGSELEIIKSSPNTFSKTKIIHIESEFRTIYQDQPLYPEVKAYLESIGFKEIYNRQPYKPEYKNFNDFNYPSDTDSIFVKI